MDIQYINFLINQIMQDTELHDFYNKYIMLMTGEDYTTYIKNTYINHEENLKEENIERFKDFILGRIRVTRNRFRKEADFDDRLINFPLLHKKQAVSKKAAFDNELIKSLIYTIINIDTARETITRPYSIQGIFTTKERTTLYPKNNAVQLENDIAYHNDKLIKREQGTLQPLFIPIETNLESITIKKNEKVYLKSKTLDIKDQRLLDFFITKYKKDMHYDNDGILKIPLSVITKVIYSKTDKQRIKWTRERLIKMSCQAFKVNEIDSEDINDLSILKLFEIKLYTGKEDGISYAEIGLSSSLKREIKNNQLLELYKDKMSNLKNDFTILFAEYLASQRIKSTIQGMNSKTLSYDVIYNNVNMPFARSKPKNLIKIKEALAELKEANFIINDFEVKGSFIQMTFIPLDYFELKKLELENESLKHEVVATATLIN